MRYRSQRIAQIPPYMFAEFKKKKEKMQQEGVDVIDLGIGDPDLPTPRHIVEKLIDEMAYPENFKYPSFNGCSEFRQAVADFYKRQFDVDLNTQVLMDALNLDKRWLTFINGNLMLT